MTGPASAAPPAPPAPDVAADAGIPPDILDHGLAEDLATTALAVARRFAAGATMWCAAPAWEPHAHHIAVEFVHPVITGTRALPAFALTGPDLAGQARVAVRGGDILIVVAAATDPAAADLMRRAPAWGAHTIWLGSGQRPPGGAADHVLWIDDADPMAPATGRFVLLYHLLWELTQVCFEHPGLLAARMGGGSSPCAGGSRDDAIAGEYCVTCSDEGRLGEVIEPPPGPLDRALVRTADGTEAVDVTLIAPVTAGDLILVHAGTALTRPGAGATP